MSEILKIECPKCGKKFDAGSAFNAHIKSTKKQQEEIIKKESEKKFKSKLEAKDKEIDKTRKEEAKKAKTEAENKFKSKLEAKDKEIDKTRKEEAKKAKTEAESKFKSQLDSKDKEIDKAKKEAEKKIKNSVSIEFQTKIQKKDDEIEKNKKAREILETRLAQKTEEINRMVKQGSVELQGEVQEERLQDYLEKIFPDDDIEEVSKGVKGGDCIQTINYKDKLNIAKIYFESKDTKIFNEQWAKKLLKDMKAKGILNGIIVCSLSCLPADFNKQKSYVERHGNLITIIPMDYSIIHAVVNRVRSILILKTRENKDHEIPAVMKKCWEFLSSPKFILPVRDMMSEITNMKEQLDKDKTSFLLSFSKKEKSIVNIKDSLTDMILPLMNLDKNVFPENILIPQENIKKLKGELKKTFETETKPLRVF